MHSRLPTGFVAGVFAVLLPACGGGEDQPTDPDEPEPQVTTIEVTPDSAELNALDATQDFDATAKDQNGNPMSGVTFSWSVNPDSVARVDNEGTVTAEGSGSATVQPEARGVTGSATLRVKQKVATITVSPESAQLNAFGATHDFEATAKDQNGNSVSGVDFGWSVSPDSVASIDSQGTATAATNGDATVEASTSDVSGSANLSVDQTVAIMSVSPDSAVSATTDTTVVFSVTASDSNGNSIASPSVSWQPQNSGVASVDSAGNATVQGEGETAIYASSSSVADTATLVVEEGVFKVLITPDSSESLVGDITTVEAQPLNIDDDLLSTSIQWRAQNGTIADVQATGTMTADVIANSAGQTTIIAEAQDKQGSSIFSAVAPVLANLQQVEAGRKHTCGIKENSGIVCWGANNRGQLGFAFSYERLQVCETADTKCSQVGLHVPLDISAVDLASGGWHACALSSDDIAYCWGDGGSGQTGASTSSFVSPSKVRTSQSFTKIVAGNTHTCGLTGSGSVYCWGRLSYVVEYGPTPTKVEGGVTFSDIASGRVHVCGISTSGDLYCWGEGSYGQLGTGFSSNEPHPSPVTGEHTWSSVSTGREHTCAINEADNIYCWGSDEFGQLATDNALTSCDLGGRTVACSKEPVQTAKSYSPTLIESGGCHTCVTTSDGLICWGRDTCSGGTHYVVDSTTPTTVSTPTTAHHTLTLARRITCLTGSSFEAYCAGADLYGTLGNWDNGSTSTFDRVRWWPQ